MSRASAAVRVAESYYDSEDADNFYALIWGGEDIHIGLYEQPADDIRTASARTVARMAAMIAPLSQATRVLDIGAGYGGAGRHLAQTSGAHVTCLNLSNVENERNCKLNEAQGLAARIDVVHGSFEDIPEPDASFDVVWSQDAILHSGDRRRVLEEAARVLKPRGELIFTDPMQADGVDDPRLLQPIYDRIHLSSLASVAFYRAELARLGFEELAVIPMTEQLRAHYAHVRAELERKRSELAGRVSRDYIERMLSGLTHWITGADRGLLAWGIPHFRKR
jgi:sarcosine/dimethylglycine N-methyltransferase